MHKPLQPVRSAAGITTRTGAMQAWGAGMVPPLPIDQCFAEITRDSISYCAD
jgi:hypothetical protein